MIQACTPPGRLCNISLIRLNTRAFCCALLFFFYFSSSLFAAALYSSCFMLCIYTFHAELCIQKKRTSSLDDAHRAVQSTMVRCNQSALLFLPPPFYIPTICSLSLLLFRSFALMFHRFFLFLLTQTGDDHQPAAPSTSKTLGNLPIHFPLTVILLLYVYLYAFLKCIFHLPILRFLFPYPSFFSLSSFYYSSFPTSFSPLVFIPSLQPFLCLVCLRWCTFTHTYTHTPPLFIRFNIPLSCLHRTVIHRQNYLSLSRLYI